MDSNVKKDAIEMEIVECVQSEQRKFCEVHGSDETDELPGIETKSPLPGSNDNVSRCHHST